MFIESVTKDAALRQEGHVCLPGLITLSWVTDMALLTEGGLCSGEIYKHRPPDGGRTRVVVDRLRATK